MERIAINEEMHLEKEWFKEARNMTIEKLPEFINHILNDYRHDYGTVCHAVAACAIAAAWAATNIEGLTGFQAEFVMWDFISQWEYSNNKCGLRIINYDNMLYPQYEETFDRVIYNDTWKLIQKEAIKKLEDIDDPTSDKVVRHWKSIADGNVPFGYRIVKDV